MFRRLISGKDARGAAEDEFPSSSSDAFNDTSSEVFHSYDDSEFSSCTVETRYFNLTNPQLKSPNQPIDSAQVLRSSDTIPNNHNTRLSEVKWPEHATSSRLRRPNLGGEYLSTRAHKSSGCQALASASPLYTSGASLVKNRSHDASREEIHSQLPSDPREDFSFTRRPSPLITRMMAQKVDATTGELYAQYTEDIEHKLSAYDPTDPQWRHRERVSPSYGLHGATWRDHDIKRDINIDSDINVRPVTTTTTSGRRENRISREINLREAALPRLAPRRDSSRLMNAPNDSQHSSFSRIGTESRAPLLQQKKRSSNTGDEEALYTGRSKAEALLDQGSTSSGRGSVDKETRDSTESTMSLKRPSSPVERSSGLRAQRSTDTTEDTTVGPSSSRGSRGKSRNDYHFHTLIGEGSLGKVYEATRIDTGEQVAVKMVKKSRILHSQTLCRLVREEVRIHTRPLIAANPNIVKLLSSFQDEAYLYYVFEYLKDGTLGKLIERLAEFREPPLVPLELVRLWMAELLGVVWTLAQERVVHRDLKPENILLSNGHVKVIDFNSAVIVPEGGTTYAGLSRVKSLSSTGDLSAPIRKDTDFGGTIPWWSPERVSLYMTRSAQQNRSPSSFLSQAASVPIDNASRRCPGVEFDLWSLGCVMYEMLLGVNPFLRGTPELTAEKIMRYSQRSASIDFPSTIGPLTRNLCLKLLEPNPIKRAELLPIDKSQLLNHPFFSGSNFQSPLSQLDAAHLIKTLLVSPPSRGTSRAAVMTPSLLEFTPEVTGQVFRGRDVSPSDQNKSSRLPYISPKTIHEYAGFGVNDTTRHSGKSDSFRQRTQAFQIEEIDPRRPKRLESVASNGAADDGRETPKHSTFSAATTAVGADAVGNRRFGALPPRSFEFDSQRNRRSPATSAASGRGSESRANADSVMQLELSATPDTSSSLLESSVTFQEAQNSKDTSVSAQVQAGAVRPSTHNPNVSCPGSIIILKSRKVSSLVQRDALLRDAFRLSPIDAQNAPRETLPFRRRRRTLSEDGKGQTNRFENEASWSERNQGAQARSVNRETSVPLVLETSLSPDRMSIATQKPQKECLKTSESEVEAHMNVNEEILTPEYAGAKHKLISVCPASSNTRVVTPPPTSSPPLPASTVDTEFQFKNAQGSSVQTGKSTLPLPCTDEGTSSSMRTTESLNVERKSSSTAVDLQTDSYMKSQEADRVEDNTVSNTAPEWVQIMCSESFREFVIEKILEELENLIGMLKPDLVEDQSSEVVSAAEILTWSPLKITITSALPHTGPVLFPPPSPPARMKEPPSLEKPLSHTSPQFMSLEGSPTMGASPLWSDTTVQRGAAQDSRILCCVRSPSYYMFNRLRRWLTPVNTPYEGTEVASGSSSSSSSGSTHENLSAVVQPQIKRTEAICYGMLSGCFGLLLFEADVKSDVCRLADVLPLHSANNAAEGSRPRLEVVNATTLSIRFPTPGFKPPVIRNMPLKFRDKDAYIQSITCDYGTPEQLNDWLSQLEQQLNDHCN